jgi:hypothetical protein
MADLVITAANVVPDPGYNSQDLIAGAAITQGQAVYLDPASGTVKLATATGTVITSALIGIALQAAAVGQPVRVMFGGNITIGAVVVVGKIYVLSQNAGNIAPEADLAAGWYTGTVGVAITAAKLALAVRSFGVQHA